VTVLLSYAAEAASALWRNRVRSVLTMLGMIVGSASIIAVFGISRAATTGITGTFASFGQLPVFVAPDPSQDDPARAALNDRDAATVSEALAGDAAAVYPNWQRTYRVSHGTVRDYESVSTDGGYHTDSLAMAQGRKISDADVASAARVCVLTQDLAKKYFPGGNPLDADLRVEGTRCRVVGVYANIKGTFMNSLVGSGVVMPFSAFDAVFSPGNPDALLIYAADPKRADAVGKETVAILQHVHGARAQYIVQNGAGFINAFDSSLNVVAVGLSAIGGVALIVAGIGIMNIMLVSVSERTREIGIRKAIGASRSNIVLQFLLEAVILALAGGGVGMAVGIAVTVGAASILSRQLGELLIPYLLIVGIALAFSFAVGMIFGTYPAVRAANLDPIEALRG
jgi:putative ABC transport system permease protein